MQETFRKKSRFCGFFAFVCILPARLNWGYPLCFPKTTWDCSTALGVFKCVIGNNPDVQQGCMQITATQQNLPLYGGFLWGAGVHGCYNMHAVWPCRHKGSWNMHCTIDWSAAAGMLFVARTGSGHVLAMDGAPEGGGNNLAPRPMELVLAGSGGCAAYDVVLMLKRGRHAVTGCQVELQSERAQSDPKVFTRIHFHFIVTGKALPQAAVERAVQLSHDKYCSASAMLGKTAQITHAVTIQEA